MRVVIVTDAWHPQVNGVVRTLSTTGRYLEKAGHEVSYITPEHFPTVPCPTYPSIRLAVLPGRGVRRQLDELRPDAIHIATEGPLGHAARRYCRRRSLRFTTSFHTQFPEYIRLRAPLPLSVSYAYLRRFHGRAAATLVPTASQIKRLEDRGFSQLRLWPRGVDTSVFRPGDKGLYEWPRPIMIYMGRVAVEKNIEAFLDARHPGTKVVIGDGPDLAQLEKAYPEAKFLGAKYGDDLAAHVAAGDVFVFPSLTDTFGLVLLEAMACGLPVAAFPVTGPIDVIEHGRSGILDEDLEAAIAGALKLAPADCIRHAHGFAWERCTAAFAECLAPNEAWAAAA